MKKYFKNVIKELKKVRFPSKKEVVSYSIATLSFIIVFAAFFFLADLAISGIRMVLK